MRLFLAPAALGLGDFVVTLPIVQSLIASGEQVVLVVRLAEHKPLAERVVGLAGVALEWEVEDMISDDDVLVDLRDHPLQREHWWGSRAFLDAYPGITINDILGTICSDKGLQIDFNIFIRLPAKKIEQLNQFIAFIPGSAVSAKCWPSSYWLSLAESIRGLNFDVVLIGQPEASDQVIELLKAGLTLYQTETIADALDAVSSCFGVVSVDTGIMHLAVHQSTPTVGIYRHAPVYVRERENFVAVAAGRACAPGCYEMETGAAHHLKPAAGPSFKPVDWPCQAIPSLQCMESIPPSTVFGALTNLCDFPSRQKDSRRSPVLP